MRIDHPTEWLKIGQKLFTAIMPKDVTITSELGKETMSFLMAYRMVTVQRFSRPLRLMECRAKGSHDQGANNAGCGSLI